MTRVMPLSEDDAEVARSLFRWWILASHDAYLAFCRESEFVAFPALREEAYRLKGIRTEAVCRLETHILDMGFPDLATAHEAIFAARS